MSTGVLRVVVCVALLALTQLAGSCAPGTTQSENGGPGTSALIVESPERLLSSGEYGTTFAPSSRQYVLRNPSPAPISWTASSNQSWLKHTPAWGILPAGTWQTLQLSIDQAVAATLPIGVYKGTVTLRDEGTGDFIPLEAELTVLGNGTSALAVTPDTPFVSTGERGKTFSPTFANYTLSNQGTTSIDWTAQADLPWVSISSTGGQIPAGGQVALTVGVDQAVAATLGLGIYNATVLVTDIATGDIFPITAILNVSAGGLLVTPTGAFASSGTQGAPSWSETDYVLVNVGTESLDWSATATTQSGGAWIHLSAPSGNLVGGATDDLTVAIDSGVAAGLNAGKYTGKVTIRDTTNGTRAERDVVLTVDPAPTSPLVVTPANGLSASGEEGGPFSPSSKSYLLENGGTTPISYTASVDQSWARLSSASGTVPAGGSTSVTVSIDQASAASLGLGTHVANVTIVDVAEPASPHRRDVTVRVNPMVGGNQATTLTQFGITWTFDGAYEVGQFANGDWWVVGPVTIVDIQPRSVDNTIAGGSWISNGSMVNPTPLNKTVQAYDSTMYAQYRAPGDYKHSLNVAYGVSASKPLVLQPHSSLVSTKSESQPNLRPQINTAAILTVLPAAAAPGDFRPAYCGSDKSIRFNESDLQYNLLRRLPIPPSVAASIPSLAQVEAMFERPWIDHVPHWTGRYLHPSTAMPDYGREIGDHVSMGAIMLHLDLNPSATTAQLDALRRTLLVRYVQLGIDLYGIAADGGATVGNWQADGGHMNGRKWPILFAGLMLGDSAMSRIGFDPVPQPGSLPAKRVNFGEDDQTFVVQETPAGSGVYNQGYGGYNALDDGLVDWGVKHPREPWNDDKDWFGNSYRLCCTSNVWWGQLLAAIVMGAADDWNNDTLFAYQDRFLYENERNPAIAPNLVGGWQLAWRDWYLDLWKALRSSYPPTIPPEYR